ncbi:hypothetical protein GC105_14285 [Alkalibaculum sp. M08DMB]|uniref:Uncharacterized protein n=1 Tax=Alkalibaculum sporogenes TaxID=2655001 RepID=A0A6A7KBM4_9FIRM|nr:hypothetical protein [Alkalibaculum sporogenes]MPW26950.1 hypothetical protein [Alkalibaculum sporogenes]
MKDKRTLLFARVFNPIALAVYGFTCYYVYSLCQYGGIKRKLPMIAVGVLLLFMWILWCSLLKPKYKNKSSENKKQQSISTEKVSADLHKVNTSKIWYRIACFILIVTTSMTAIGIYRSGINYNGKLSWFIADLKNKREVEFTQNNIYEYGIEGIFDAIENKMDIPKELFVSSDFILRFEKGGNILSFDTYLYGRNENGETESFLITYNANRSPKITVYLNGYVNEDYDQQHRLEPLFDMLQVIQLENTVSKWNQEEYGILYSGLRNWGYNTSGIVTIDKEGMTQQEEYAEDQIVGFTVSVYVPGKESIFIPKRFIADWETVTLEPEITDQEKQAIVGYTDIDGEEAFFLDQGKGYRLTVADAALGSRFYVLDLTLDGGLTWETINKDPFSNEAGVSAGITFIDENLGFIGISHSGGSYGNLFRSEDGGKLYKQVVIPKVEVSLNESETYVAFDLPGMPYKEGEKLSLLVEQGEDGDYKGGIKALYQSEDRGITWKYIKEVENE